ncbi:hypothetical protein F503_07318 [Ophiostoma piceae UAMH 11346]|uniref:Uncharacterized protein n=1 Tax=Ophiostoma piceae (strain UAMH 11346) TaxID=1262450 RepID=S3C9L1_OPHP1|nr:hypothetical protein F503_07318 [Ophiostoma piceae UAMH 11346]
MGIRDHGYYGYAFVGARPCQIIALSAVIGMTGHFISDNIHTHIAVPSQIVGTLVISCIALLWALISFTAYDDTHFPYHATSAVDLLLVIPFIVVAAVLGGPLGAVTCSALPGATYANESDNDLLAIQVSGSSGSTETASYMLFVGDNQTTCYAIMAAWGLTIALSILYAFSGFATGLLFLGQRRLIAAERAANPPPPVIPMASHAYPQAPGAYYPEQRQIDPEAARKWHEAEDDDEYDYDDDRSSVHPESAVTAATLPTAAAYPSAGGRTLHPRLSAHVPPRIKIQTTKFCELDENDDDKDDKDDGDDKDDYENDYDFERSGLTTPLSPPPPTHQNKSLTGTPSSSGSGGRSRSVTPVSPMFDRPRTRDSSSSFYRQHHNHYHQYQNQNQNQISPKTNSYTSTVSVATATATTLVYQYLPGPHTVMPISAALSVSPVSSIVPDVQTVDPLPPSRSLTKKYTPPITLTVPDSPASPSPVVSPPSAKSLWFQLSPIRLHNHGFHRSHNHNHRQSTSLSPLTVNNSPLSPISPILSSLPPSKQNLHASEKPAQRGAAWRKTLLQRIEGWWDLGLLRNGTIKGRAGTSGSLATGNASILPMTTNSSTPSTRAPFSFSRANSRTDEGISMSPVAFV